MPLWVSDFIGDTLELDAKQIGAYMLLLMAMWQHGGTLPADPKKLQRVARIGRDWPKVWADLERFFQVENGKISNKRLTLELHRVAAKRALNAHAGALGGRAKSLKNKDQGLANALAKSYQPEPEPYNTKNPPLYSPPETPEEPNGNGRTKASAGETDAGLAGADNATDATAETPDSDAGADRPTPRRDPPKPIKRATRVAVDFWPDATGERTFWQSGGTDLDKAVDFFRDYWTGCAGNKGTKLDWHATWRNWCRSAAEREYSSPGFGNGNGTRSGPSEPGLANLFAAASSRGDDGY